MSLVFPLILFLGEFYFFRKIYNSLKTIKPDLNRRKYKLILYPVIIYLNIYAFYVIYTWIYRYSSGGERISTPDSPLFQYFIIYPFTAFILLVAQVDIYLLIILLLRLIFHPLIKKAKEKWNRREAWLVLLIAAFFLLYVPGRIIYDYYSVAVRIVEYKDSRIPADLEGFRIAFISDVQADEYTDEERLGNFISKVNSTKPGLVLMGGDVITNTPFFIKTAAEFIGQIKAPYGVYSCVGDHDNWAYRNDYDRSLMEVTEALSSVNVPMIDNQSRSFQIRNSTIGVTFATNNYMRMIREETIEALASEVKNTGLRIFITHQPRPDIVNEAAKLGYDLFLAGHTHGGQISFLLPFSVFSPTRFETRFVRGTFDIGKMKMIVTRGLGMSILPVRYNSTPEVTLIVLSRK